MSNVAKTTGGGFPGPASRRAKGTLFHRKIALSALKRCPLCEAVNARSNEECFICGWRGQFLLNSAAVRDGVEELLELCPELADAVTRPEPCTRQWARELRSFWFRFVHRFSPC